jgi:hypothetical protein
MAEDRGEGLYAFAFYRMWILDTAFQVREGRPNCWHPQNNRFALKTKLLTLHFHAI